MPEEDAPNSAPQSRRKYEKSYHNRQMELSDPNSIEVDEYGRDFKTEVWERNRIVNAPHGMGGSNVYPLYLYGRLSMHEAEPGVPAQVYVRLHERGEAAFASEEIADTAQFRTIIDDPERVELYIESHLRSILESSDA